MPQQIDQTTLHGSDSVSHGSLVDNMTSPKPVKRMARFSRRTKWLLMLSAVLVFVILFGVYSIAADPYSSDTFVNNPFTTRYTDGQVVLTQHFSPHVYHGWFFSAFAYVEQTATDLWARLRSPHESAGSVQAISSAIYAQRFDPNKPYIISGDQFGGFYLRNPGVFYQDLLDQHTALNDTDWRNRERLAVQSLAYALVATQQLKYPVTTLMPVSPHGIIAVNFWSYPSDTMFSLFSVLQKLETDPETRQAASQLQREYGSGLAAAYQNYLATVRDPTTGLVRGDIHISSARDAAQRQSSFYDNVILWRTEQLANQLGYTHVSQGTLDTLHQAILRRYWDNAGGHFIDDARAGDQNSYSSDWLIVLPTGFLNPANPDDLKKLERISSYIDAQGLTNPLPIRYTADKSTGRQDFFVKVFVGSYTNTAIWSYWGDLYITLETDLYKQTGQTVYARHVETSLSEWQRVITKYQGYPETLNAHGQPLETLVYRSIMRNGWIVDFNSVEYTWQHIPKRAPV